ncbi:MAG: hypothetical protein A3E01_07840 [Gammaproteobacteria bacterium RIFCSPHIGHO2_12_FULL_63_22]|nr:MAG: hypothetical protein A3E01_07840 [Gammaproteobacteria bacterium RIFCSPHIGHO2_12_FULL_63_22]
MALVLLRGIDANWDLRNYHLYNPHAWLTGRMLIDIAPAQLQTWHNPLLDVPLYLLATSGLDSRWISVWLTIPYSVAFMLLLRLQSSLATEQPTRAQQAILIAVALTGAATYSTIGNSMNDGFVAVAILGALVIVLVPENASHRRWLLAGFLAGAVMGLKLTASVYCVALAFAALPHGPWLNRIQRLAALALGGLCGFVATYGYWAWLMRSLHGNPFFPYFNNFFKAAELPGHVYTDGRFRADGLWDALLVPVELLQKSYLFSELHMKDPRLFLGVVCIVALYFIRRRKLSASTASARRMGTLAVFYSSALIIWALQFGIYRYANTLELLGSLGFVLAMTSIPRSRVWPALLASIVVISLTTRPNWGHVESTAPKFGIQPAPIPDNSLVLIASGEPIAFLALGLPRATPLVAVSNSILLPEECSLMQVRAIELIDSHPGPIWLLSANSPRPEDGQALLTKWYGLVQQGECLEFTNSLVSAKLCPQSRSGPIIACQK